MKISPASRFASHPPTKPHASRGGDVRGDGWSAGGLWRPGSFQNGPGQGEVLGHVKRSHTAMADGRWRPGNYEVRL